MKNSAVTQFVQREGGESGEGKVSRGCIFKWMHLGFWPLLEKKKKKE